MSRKLQLTQSYWDLDDSRATLETTLGDLLASLAGKVPDRTALVEGTADASKRRRWTYRQLLTSAETVARALLQHFKPGERVAVWSANSAEWVFLQHGASLAGLVLVTVNPAYLSAELSHVLATSGAAGIFYTNSYRGHDMAETVRALRPHLPGLRVAISFSDWDEFVAGGDASTPLPRVEPGDMIQIQFTSGTTGKPKGACLHHRGVINAARFTAMRAGVRDGAPWASAMPLFHVGGCAGSEIGAFSVGGTFVLLPAFDAGVMLELIETERVQHIHAVPTMVSAMLDHPDRPQRDLSSLGSIMSGGSNVAASLVKRASETFGCNFTITFGQTELNGVICQTFPDDPPERQSTTIGQPSPQMEVKIADPNTGEVLPLGQPGEIWARGYQTMLGYFNADASASQAITSDGWLKTGDQATMDAAGYLRITGRLKDCIIRGGENIYPREIEDVLLTHPSIREVNVVGVPDPTWGEVVAAAIKLHPSVPRPPALDFHEFSRKHLAPYKTPVMWFYVDEFPTTTSGKVQKFQLRQLMADGSLQPEPFVKPQRRPVG
ncbi:AMP-binding protein [soil metagenome]